MNNSVFKTVVEHSGLGVYIKDMDGRFTYANTAFGTLLGVDVEAIIGKTDANFYTPDELVRTASLDHDAIREATPRSDDEAHVFDGRTSAWVTQRLPILDDSGTVTQLCGIVRDVTHEREIQGQLQHLQKLDAVGLVAGTIAHDFNNYIGAIVGYASVMQLSMGPDAQWQQEVKAISKAASKASVLSRQLLAYARPTESHTEVVSATKVLSETLDLLRHSVPRAVQIEVDHSAVDDAAANADAAELGQALFNLGINARDAMPDGGTLKYTVSIDKINQKTKISGLPVEPGQYVRIDVSDNGTGITPGVIEKMFEPFYTTKPKGQGTGLGLNMVYQMMKRLSGAVQVESTVGEGTTFSLLLPSADVPEGQAQSFTDSGVYVRPELPHGKERILFVDDEMVMLMFVSRILQQLGYEVVTKNNGRDAIDFYQENGNQIDLVLLDWVMPMPDGATVLSAIRAHHPESTVVITTGFGVDRIPATVLESVNGFLLKPFGAKEIATLVREILDGARSGL